MTRPLDPERMPPDRAGYAAYRPIDPAIRRAVWGHIGRYVERWVDPVAPALDLGAGRCDFVAAVRSSRRIGLDMSEDLLAEAPATVETMTGDVTDLSRFADRSVGTALSSNLLEHLEWPEMDRLSEEVHRVLQPGGHFIIVNPNFRLAYKSYFDNYTHRTIHTDRSLPGYFRVRGWEIAHVEGRFLPFTMHSRFSIGHKLVPLYLKLPFRPLAGQMLVVVRKPAGS